MAFRLDLEKKSILVTGASRGIGKSIALELGAAGAYVGVSYTGSSASSESNARSVAEEIEKTGGKAILLPLDLASEEQINASVDTMVKTFGRLDGLVNNAGIVIDNLAMRYKSEDFDKLMNVNLKGTFLMCKASLRPLMKAGGGSIVNMSSVVGEMGNAGQVPYSASKAALIGMTKSLAREVGSRQIRVNAIAPGFIETDMTHSMTPEQRESLSKNIALGRIAKPEEIAHGTLFLLSPVSAYVTGHVLSINGGLYM